MSSQINDFFNHYDFLYESDLEMQKGDKTNSIRTTHNILKKTKCLKCNTEQLATRVNKRRCKTKNCIVYKSNLDELINNAMTNENRYLSEDEVNNILDAYEGPKDTPKEGRIEDSVTSPIKKVVQTKTDSSIAKYLANQLSLQLGMDIEQLLSKEALLLLQGRTEVSVTSSTKEVIKEVIKKPAKKPVEKTFTITRPDESPQQQVRTANQKGLLDKQFLL